MLIMLSTLLYCQHGVGTAQQTLCQNMPQVTLPHIPIAATPKGRAIWQVLTISCSEFSEVVSCYTKVRQRALKRIFQ